MRKLVEWQFSQSISPSWVRVSREALCSVWCGNVRMVLLISRKKSSVKETGENTWKRRLQHRTWRKQEKFRAGNKNNVPCTVPEVSYPTAGAARSLVSDCLWQPPNPSQGRLCFQLLGDHCQAWLPVGIISRLVVGWDLKAGWKFQNPPHDEVPTFLASLGNSEQENSKNVSPLSHPAF